MKGAPSRFEPATQGLGIRSGVLWPQRNPAVSRSEWHPDNSRCLLPLSTVFYLLRPVCGLAYRITLRCSIQP